MQQIELQAGHQLGQIPGFIAIGSLGAVMLGISLYSRAELVKNTHDFIIAGRKPGSGFGVAGLVSVWTWVVGILMPENNPFLRPSETSFTLTLTTCIR
jgi:urea-proton symporter